METWYELFNGDLSEVQVERSTKTNVWVEGVGRRAKFTRWNQYFPSKQAAYEYMIARALADVATYQYKHRRALSKLESAKKLLQDLNQLDAFKEPA